MHEERASSTWLRAGAGIVVLCTMKTPITAAKSPSGAGNPPYARPSLTHPPPQRRLPGRPPAKAASGVDGPSPQPSQQPPAASSQHLYGAARFLNALLTWLRPRSTHGRSSHIARSSDVRRPVRPHVRDRPDMNLPVAAFIGTSAARISSGWSSRCSSASTCCTPCFAGRSSRNDVPRLGDDRRVRRRS